MIWHLCEVLLVQSQSGTSLTKYREVYWSEHLLIFSLEEKDANWIIWPIELDMTIHLVPFHVESF